MSSVLSIRRNEDGNGKSTPPVKRGPGRPRKRKYFGATSKSGKPSPLRTTSPHTPSGAQSPDTNCVPSEPESVISKESEPPKKKKKAKQKTYAEDERRSKTPPSRGFSPVELSVSSPRSNRFILVSSLSVDLHVAALPFFIQTTFLFWGLRPFSW